MDVDTRTKVLTRRITVHKSEIPSGRDTRRINVSLLSIFFLIPDSWAFRRRSRAQIPSNTAERRRLPNSKQGNVQRTKTKKQSYSFSTPSVYWSRLGRFGALLRESKGFQRLYNKALQLEIRHVSFIHC